MVDQGESDYAIPHLIPHLIPYFNYNKLQEKQSPLSLKKATDAICLPLAIYVLYRNNALYKRWL